YRKTNSKEVGSNTKTAQQVNTYLPLFNELFERFGQRIRTPVISWFGGIRTYHIGGFSSC
ncbi:MAG TPA: hypothetical protein VE544_11965, partial [Nitrososphaeraceae archaeon]|nr:hypothetical protein [Nitrososphaeraceae archaeon]